MARLFKNVARCAYGQSRTCNSDADARWKKGRHLGVLFVISYENEERMLYNEKRKVRYTYINNAFALIVFSIAFYLSCLGLAVFLD